MSKIAHISFREFVICWSEQSASYAFSERWSPHVYFGSDCLHMILHAGR